VEEKLAAALRSMFVERSAILELTSVVTVTDEEIEADVQSLWYETCFTPARAK
jgi:hypothetical protein